MGKKGFEFGEKHPRWRGGRSISSAGYVLVRHPSHPRAFSNGYVYEHFLVAEKKLGRPLLSTEVVHHSDEDKQNNHPDNLIIEPSAAHHRFHHRKYQSAKKSPDEPNMLIMCACGCGARFLKYDTVNRPRRYVSGHNMRKEQYG